MFPAMLSSSTGTPCRKTIRKGHQNFAHFFPSLKNGLSVGCESHLETEGCLLLEHDLAVRTYYAQPHCFKWTDAGTEFCYTPDFLVHCVDGSFYLLEVKHDFDHLEEHYRDKLNTFAELCGERGWTYRQWSAAQIRGHANLETLKYLYSRAHHIDPADKFFFGEAAQHINMPITLGRLLAQLPQFSLNLICHQLFYRALRADLRQTVTLDFLIDGVV
ncbi:TnsA endonuclease N-terminal domain-containing protein [Pseudomonas fluorescens]|uniref:TnsA endonuclease N-terminal domain-containing protein n=1 Tax=Pseudomonas fluorescens TaxID=294 RepID=UPI001A9CD2C8|nr:TnsA endonuclease N-terminal domain-containing protein [Pseudomonas fluorescens]QTD31735.1 TnsA endonuclease N-terminal domain-containing protein [Pseudomonas fluorescens]